MNLPQMARAMLQNAIHMNAQASCMVSGWIGRFAVRHRGTQGKRHTPARLLSVRLHGPPFKLLTLNYQPQYDL